MQRIFLIGYRGTGKTTVARLLANKLDWSWTDADALLEERHGRSIGQIFAEEGETGFRDKEAVVLLELARRERHVIATGGGVILRPDNRALLRTGGVIWLTATTDVLWERVRADATSSARRPDLAQGGLLEIEEMVRQRVPLYSACADWTVDTDSKSPDDVASAILQWLLPSPS